MKTPKRQKANLSDYATNIHYHDARARWRRKNRIKQLKHTIAILKAELAAPHPFTQADIPLIIDALATHGAYAAEKTPPDNTCMLHCLDLLTRLNLHN